MKYPALAIAFSLAAGILAGGIFVHRLPHAFVLSLLTVLFLIVAGLLLFFGRRDTSAGLVAVLAWCVLGIAAAQLEPLTVPANHVTRQIISQDGTRSDATQINLGQPLRWRGRLRSDPLRLPWGMRDELDLEQVQSSGVWRPISGGLRLTYFFNERDDPAAQESFSSGEPAAPNARADTVTNSPAIFVPVIAWKSWCAPPLRETSPIPAPSTTKLFSLTRASP